MDGYGWATFTTRTVNFEKIFFLSISISVNNFHEFVKYLTTILSLCSTLIIGKAFLRWCISCMQLFSDTCQLNANLTQLKC